MCSAEREGTHCGHWTYQFSNSAPWDARRSMLGVRRTGFPMQPSASARFWSQVISSRFQRSGAAGAATAPAAMVNSSLRVGRMAAAHFLP